MESDRPSGTVHGIRAPAARLTWQAAALLAAGVSSAFLILLAGFSIAVPLVWPG